MTEWLKTDQAVISTYITYLQKNLQSLKIIFVGISQKTV